MKTSIGLAGVALAAAVTLSACGGSGTDAYCDDLKAAQEDFSSLSTGDLGQIDEAFTTLRELADEAPEDIAEEWKTVGDAIGEIQAGLEESGLELADLQSGELPEGVEQEDLQPLLEAYQGLAAADVATAQEAISTHATDECDVDLGGS